MRKLMWFTIGFGIACALCAYGLPGEWIVPSMLVSACLLAAGLWLSRKWKPVRTAAMTAFGCIIGLCWCLLFRQYYLAPVVFLDCAEQEVVITVTDYSYATEYGTGVDGIVDVEGKTYQIRAYMDEELSLVPGDRVSGLFRLRITTPDGEKGATYHQGKGIFLLAYQQDAVNVTKAAHTPRWSLSARLRLAIKSILQDCFPEDTLAFAKALLLGDTKDLSYEMDTAFKLSGIRHVVAVSGLHITILFALISILTFRKRYLTALVGIPVLILFAAVAGFTPSVVRACIMSGLMLLALLFDREYDGATALSFAALVMLAVNPLTITSVSFQLSVASVAGIYLFREGIENWLQGFFGKDKKQKWKRKLQKWFASSVAITLSAMTLTTPLCAYHFGTVSLIGVVTNLLTLWVISFQFYGIMGVCLLGHIWTAGGMFLAKMISLPIRYVLWMAGILADFPLAAVYTNSVYITAWLVFCYVLLVVFLLQRKRKPIVLGCCACIGLCIALIASWAEPLLDDTRLTVLDVGQGQAMILQSEGRNYLIDCGGDSDTQTADTVAQTLLSQGVHRLDGIILTHYDRDHAGGLEYLLTRIQTDLLLVPDTVDVKTYPQVDGTVCYVDEDLEITFGDAKLTVFGPIYSGSSNENSLCVLFERENCAILVTGDRSGFGERMLLRHTCLTDVDVLIAGHHGAKTSTSEALLQAVTPETVFISVGENNIYGHPDEALLERLREFGCSVYRTDVLGTIIYRR